MKLDETRKIILTIWIIIFAGGILLSILVFGFGFRPECTVYKYTHLVCAGCGGTRMVKAFFSGDLAFAFRENQLMFILYPTVFLISVLVFWGKPKFVRKPGFLYTVLAVVMVLSLIWVVIRNLPGYEMLRPLDYSI